MLYLLHDVVRINDKSSTLNQGPRHFNILGSQVEISQQVYEVSWEHALIFLFSCDFFHVEFGQNIVEFLSCSLELARAKMNNTNIKLLNDFCCEFLTILFLVVNIDFPKLLFNLLNELFGIHLFLIIRKHLIRLTKVLMGLLESGEHAVSFSQIHMNIVLRRLGQLVSFIHSQQLFAVVDAVSEVICNQVHVAQVLMSVLYKTCMFLLDL